jgi:glycosyltransferase involved in cell wall biosynthesis
MTVSAIIPAYNESENVALVVSGLLALRTKEGCALVDEVIVADNNSDDDTAAVAAAAGARVISVLARGYGSACAAACEAAVGDVLLFVDGDHTADLKQTSLLLGGIDGGADMVIGVRANAARGSLTLPQRFGNAFACALVRTIWRVPITDLGPFRAIRRAAYERIGMRDRAYGWTIEMQVRAAQLHLCTTEVDVSWFPRHAGASKVSGTVRGVLGAGFGILSMIVQLWWRESRAQTVSKTADTASICQSNTRTPAETDCPHLPHAGRL